MNKVTTNVDLNIIRNNIDPITFQVGTNCTKEQIYDVIVKKINKGHTLAFQRNKYIMLLNPEHKWLAEVHLFSDNKSFSRIDPVIITKYIFTNHPFLKIYGKFSDKRIVSLAHKTNWKVEGCLTKSYSTTLDGSGEFKDLIICSASREDFIDR